MTLDERATELASSVPALIFFNSKTVQRNIRSRINPPIASLRYIPVRRMIKQATDRRYKKLLLRTPEGRCVHIKNRFRSRAPFSKQNKTKQQQKSYIDWKGQESEREGHHVKVIARDVVYWAAAQGRLRRCEGPPRLLIAS